MRRTWCAWNRHTRGCSSRTRPASRPRRRSPSLHRRAGADAGGLAPEPSRPAVHEARPTRPLRPRRRRWPGRGSSVMARPRIHAGGSASPASLTLAGGRFRARARMRDDSGALAPAAGRPPTREAARAELHRAKAAARSRRGGRRWLTGIHDDRGGRRGVARRSATCVPRREMLAVSTYESYETAVRLIARAGLRRRHPRRAHRRPCDRILPGILLGARSQRPARPGASWRCLRLRRARRRDPLQPGPRRAAPADAGEEDLHRSPRTGRRHPRAHDALAGHGNGSGPRPN